MNIKRALSIILTVCLICSFSACRRVGENGSETSVLDSSAVSEVISLPESSSSDVSSADNSVVSTAGSSNSGTASTPSSNPTNGNQVVIEKPSEVTVSNDPVEKGLDFGGRTLKLAVGYTTTSTFATMVKAFESTYNCKIEVTQLSFDKYLADLAAKVTSGEVFDIVYVHGSFYPNCFIKGFYQPLDGVFTTADLYDVNNLAAGGIDKVKSEGFS